jgi:hypothetical protein
MGFIVRVEHRRGDPLSCRRPAERVVLQGWTV